jgi:hypothetical protein
MNEGKNKVGTVRLSCHLGKGEVGPKIECKCITGRSRCQRKEGTDRLDTRFKDGEGGRKQKLSPTVVTTTA